MKKICFVCLGNICRSPMAEFVMKQMVQRKDMAIESRATSHWEEGNPIHPGTQTILKTYQIPYDKHKGSQQISLSDLEHFDLLVAMDESNLQELYRLSQGRFDHKLRLLLDRSVPDPWYTGDFEETYALITEGCRHLLQEIEG